MNNFNPIGPISNKDKKSPIDIGVGIGASGNAAFLSSVQPSIFDNSGAIPNGENLKIGDYLNGQKTA